MAGPNQRRSRPLLVEEEFGIAVEPPGQALEAGRVVIPAATAPAGAIAS